LVPIASVLFYGPPGWLPGEPFEPPFEIPAARSIEFMAFKNDSVKASDFLEMKGQVLNRRDNGREACVNVHTGKRREFHNCNERPDFLHAFSISERRELFQFTVRHV
jgi:hypothetical protein